MIALEHLEALEAIVEEGSFRLAAKRLFKAQSAVSYSIKTIEEQLQVSLFDRSGYRPVLTDEGTAFLKKAKSLLAHAREFETYSKELGGEVETDLYLSLSALYPVAPLAKVLNQIQKEYPHTNLHIQVEVLSGEYLLMKEEVNIAFFEFLTVTDEFEACKVDEVQMPIVISRKHPIFNEVDNPSASDLISYPQIIVKSTIPNEKSAGIVGDAHKWYVNDLKSKRDLIVHANGWGRLPKYLIEKELKNGTLREIQSKGGIVKSNLYMAKKKSRALGPVGRRFWELVESEIAF